MKRWALLILALICVAPAVTAETLEHIVTLNDGGEVYIDSESLLRLPPIKGDRPFPVVQLAVIYDLSGNRREKARSARSLINFNCQKRIGNVIAYKKLLPSGDRVYDWRGADVDFKYEAIVPASQMDELLARACGFPKPQAAELQWVAPVPLVPPGR
jgi:hypothetical protein